MCVICVSPKGAPQPTHDQIRTMFEHKLTFSRYRDFSLQGSV